MRTHTSATFHHRRNVALEERIKREVWPKSDAYVRFLALRLEEPTAARHVNQHWQAVRKAIARALEDHLHYFEGVLLQPMKRGCLLPDDIARLLRGALLDLCNGDSHPLLTPMHVPGGTGHRNTRRQQLLIADAVHYLTAVDQGRVRNANSRRDVAKSFDVTRRQVQRWVVAAGPLSTRAAAYRQRFDELFPRADEKSRARIVIKLMKGAGREYRKTRMLAE